MIDRLDDEETKESYLEPYIALHRSDFLRWVSDVFLLSDVGIRYTTLDPDRTADVPGSRRNRTTETPGSRAPPKRRHRRRRQLSISRVTSISRNSRVEPRAGFSAWQNVE